MTIPSISRRTLLASALALAGGATARAQAGSPFLAEIAKSRSLLYGCAVGSANLANDKPFSELVSKQAGILVPEGELKRRAVQPREGVWDFHGADAIHAFADRHGQLMRGHTLVWYYGVPDWLLAQLKTAPRESMLTDMITKSCEHFRGRMHSWDVINEVIEPPEGHPDGLRSSSPWYQAFGDSYMATAFHAAREADPKALLFYGEYGIEMNEEWHRRRRTAVLKLLEKLKKQNAPIDAFGIQGHLKPFEERFDEMVFARFLRDVSDMGLKLMITELDAADRSGPQDIPKRDAEVAAYTGRFLDVTLDNPAVLGVLTWGLSDRYSWLSTTPGYKRADGQLSRGLPYDQALDAKPMRTAMAGAMARRS